MISAGSRVVLPMGDMGKTITLEVERIENGTAYFGKCIEGYISIDEIICEDGETIEVGSVMETFLRETNYELRIEIGKIENNMAYFSKCVGGSVPQGYLDFISKTDLYGGMPRCYVG